MTEFFPTVGSLARLDGSVDAQQLLDQPAGEPQDVVRDAVDSVVWSFDALQSRKAAKDSRRREFRGKHAASPTVVSDRPYRTRLHSYPLRLL